jgi:hypothetical protein
MNTPGIVLTPKRLIYYISLDGRLAGAYSELSENPKYSKGLTQVLKECEALKKSIAVRFLRLLGR